ncbi:hypothetical protein F7R91_22745 [Streptomyces luteolifulvus]|uniref:Uncharacterized protein n=1 Tax=Streptomyces luteolifulvus TaxID=2615112 RepID=A0A6H9UZH5_9ACTN|nr:hypothetical protein [Streptomyces luteolifulvus]KAB1144179.1 hypothetical protein F7R91_22745 [Streptomyces luteolifulvus]
MLVLLFVAALAMGTSVVCGIVVGIVSTGRRKRRVVDQAGSRFRVRDGFGIAGFVVFLVAGMAALLLILGTCRRFARETVPVLLDLPGGSWTVGGVLGLVSVLGWVSGVEFGFRNLHTANTTRLMRGIRAAGSAVCWGAAFGPFMYLLSGLPAKNCRSYDSSCVYVPGTGTAFLAFVGGVRRVRLALASLARRGG